MFNFNPDRETILDFIKQFRTHSHRSLFVRDSDGRFISSGVMESVIRNQFRYGYCYHFALILQSLFGCGDVCVAAPFDHIVWVWDGVPYDIDGKYDGGAKYLIPISYLSEDDLIEFAHIPGHEANPDALTHEYAVGVMKRYCTDNNIQYDATVEDELRI